MAKHTLDESEYCEYVDLKNKFNERLEKEIGYRKKEELWFTRIGWWILGVISTGLWAVLSK